ncbi:MAG: lamin tail domain-containing protein, partial [Bacteroidetes bacterium]
MTGMGNTISNLGGGSSITYGIYSDYQNNLSIRDNNVNTGANAGTGIIRGIHHGVARNATSEVVNNTITIQASAATTNQCIALATFAGSREGRPASDGINNTVSILNNTIQNSTYPADGTNDLWLIFSGKSSLDSLSARNLFISGNQLVNNTSSSNNASGSMYGIIHQIIADSCRIENNNISNNTANGNVAHRLRLLITGWGGSSVANYSQKLYVNGNTANANSTNSTTAAFDGFLCESYTSASPMQGVLEMKNNTITNMTFAAQTTGAFTGISASAPTTSTVNIDVDMSGNTVSNITRTTATTGAFNGIRSLGTSRITSVVMDNNTLSGISQPAATTSVVNGITSGGSSTVTTTVSMSNNQVMNFVTNGTGTLTLMDAGLGVTLTVNGNTVSGNQRTGASGTTYCIRASTSQITFNGNTITNNSHTNTSGTSASSLYGYYNFGSPTLENITNNNVNNLSLLGTNTSTSSLIYGLYSNTTASATKIISGNTVHTLTSTLPGSIHGMHWALGTDVNVFKNKVYNLASSTTSTTTNVYGIHIASGSANVYNNIVGDLRAEASASTDAIRGISVASTTTSSNINIYHNSIRLDGTSTGTNFGTSGIYTTTSTSATTAALDLSYNIVINLTTPKGTGRAAAYRRSSTTLTNFTNASNRNIYYAGTPATNNVIFFDGTNADQTLAAYKTRVSPREANSFTENSVFQSVVSSDANFLKLSLSSATFAEGGAVQITSPPITDDYFGTLRSTSAPDIGAHEDNFLGVLPVLSNLTITPSAPQCSSVAHTVTVDVTSPVSSPITAVWLFFQPTGGALDSVQMTNTSGNTYQGTIPAKGDSIVTWWVRATDSQPYNSFSANATYQDAYLGTLAFNVNADPNPMCLGETTDLSALLIAPNPAQIGTATTTTSTYPYYRLYGSSKTQMMYRANELTAAGLVAGDITALGFDVTSALTNMPNVTIALKNSSNNTLPDFETGMTTVYTAADFIPVVGVNMHQFQTPFNWNGTSNLIVEFCFENNDAGGSSSTVRYSNPGFAATYKRYMDNNPTFCSNPTAGTVSSSSTIRPNLFIAQPQPGITYTWSSTSTDAGLNASSGSNVTATPTGIGVIVYDVLATDGNGCTVSNSVSVTVNSVPLAPSGTNSTQCGIAIPTASVSSNNSPSGTFMWYDAASGGTLLQTGGTSYASPISSPTNFYVSEEINGCESTRTLVFADVTAPDPVTIVITPDTICLGTTVTIQAQSTNTNYAYIWSAATEAGLSGNTGSNITATPTEAGDFTISVSADDGSCLTSASNTLVVKPYPSAVALGNDTTVCPGSSVILHADLLTGSGAFKISEVILFYTGTGSQSTKPAYIVQTDDFIEITNASTVAGDLSGYTLNYQLTTGTPAAKTFPNGTIVPAGAVVVVYIGTAAEDPANLYFSLGGSTPGSGSAMGIWLKDPSNNVVDAIALNTYSGFPAGSGVTAADWNLSANISSPTSSAGPRLEGADMNDNTNWVSSHLVPTTSIGYTNPGIPLAPPPGSLSWSSIPAGFTASGNDVNTGPINSATTFVVVNDNGFCQTSDTIVVNTFTPLPAPTATNSSQCGVGVPTCSVSTSGFIMRWYLTPTGGTPLAGESSTSLASYSISTTTTFYVSEFDGSCESDRTPVTATVASADAITVSGTPSMVCPGETVTLTSNNNSGPLNYTYTWNANPVSGSGMPSPVVDSTVIVTPTLSGTYYYVVTANDAAAGCTVVDSVEITVKPRPVISGISVSPSESVCSGTTVTLTAASTCNVPGNAFVGNGTSSNGAQAFPAPYGNYYWGARHQMLIKAADMTAAGFAAGNLTSIAFDNDALNSVPALTNFTISMKLASLASIIGFETGLTQVYTASSYTPVVGVNTHTFSTPFFWNGTSDIVIETCFNNSGFLTNGNASTKYTTTAYTSVVFYRADNATVCGTSTVSGTSANRPNMGFNGTIAGTGACGLNWVWNPGNVSGNVLTVTPSVNTTYTVTATDPITNCTTDSSRTIEIITTVPTPVITSSTNLICNSGSVTLNMTNALQGVNHQWQNSSDGISWSDIPSATNDSYTATINSSTYFRVYSGCASADTSNVEYVQVDVPTVSASGVTRCGPGPVNLTATGNGTFSWYTVSTGGTAVATGSTYSPTVSSTTTFYVESAIGACINAGGRVAVVVTVTTPPTVSIASSPGTSICNGSSVTLTASSSNDPDYTYNWSVDQTTVFATGAVQTVSPTANTTYYVYAVDSSNGANHGCAAVASQLITVLPVPATPLISPANPAVCSTGGSTTLTISNPEINQGTKTFGNQTSSSSTGAPYRNGLSAGTRVQYLYTASELSSSGITSGNLLSVGFNVVSAGSGSIDLTIRLKATNTASLATTFETGTFTTVYTATGYTVTAGLNTHTFSSPFFWNGTSNIIVEVCQVTVTTGSSPTVSMFSIGSSSTYSTVTNPCVATTGTAGTNRPVTTIGYNSSNTYVWQPGGLTGVSVSVSPTSNTTYTVTATNPVGCTSSNSVLVVYEPVTVPTITPSGPTTFCPGESVTLDAGAGYTNYNWSDGSTVVGNSQTLLVSPSATTTYTVTVDNGGICTQSASQTITVHPFTQPVISADNPSICLGQETATLTLNDSYASYLWSPGGETTSSITVSTGGTYSVSVTAANGCSGSANINIIGKFVPPVPSVTPVGPINLCWDGSTDATAVLTVDTTGAGPGASILWNDLFVSSDDNITVFSSLVFSPFDQLNATVTSGDGCSVTSNT